MSDDEGFVYGFHSVEELLETSPRSVRRVLLVRGRQDARAHAVRERAARASIRVDIVDRSTLDRLTARGAHQGIVAECLAVPLSTEADLEARWDAIDVPLLLVLDGIEDPRNLGACLRSADAAGVDAVLVPKRGSAPLSNVARKTASGAAESLFIVEVVNLARRMEWLRERGVWIIGAADDAPADYTGVDYRGSTAVVVGAEDRGLRRLTRSKCDHLVRIPMLGRVASLNVSVATGILLFEAVRQRGSGR